ncbi:hypothetical protein FZC83_21345 [Rossellomorea marisflavi]|uniref:DUF4367 domain-containing protein n=1 Tax=Rossellomorea marisflavi TaxID=189381 RepID=A0A5D4R9S9_9BACI|nr:hypothetical protein [Rossellomorea marisflavi]TYS48223.1 hypothetical protein FZC83_21345 [Rossellomorea marisflavi]
MKKLIVTILSVIILIFCMVQLKVSASADAQDQALVKEMRQEGYQAVNEAVAKFEKENNLNVKLPEEPIKANINLGKASSIDITIKWFDTESSPPISATLTIRKGIKNQFLNKKNAEVVKLSNGAVGFYKKDKYHTITFTSAGLNYQYSTKATSSMSKEEVINLANHFK